MASPERGTKRQCLQCSTKFYDLNRDPILCPSCGTEFLIETLAAKTAPAEEKSAPAAPKSDDEDDVDTAAVEAGAEVISLSDAEDDDDDDDDIPDVEDVEVDDELGGDNEDAFLESDDEDENKIDFDVTPNDRDDN